MRSGRWILAICGLVGLALNAVVAEERSGDYDRSAFDSTSSRRTIQYFSGNSDKDNQAEWAVDNKNSSGNKPASVSSNGMPSRYSRNTRGEQRQQPRVKNYYNELFGESRSQSGQKPRKRQTKKDTQSKQKERLGQASPFSSSKRKVRQAGYEEPASKTRESVDPDRSLPLDFGKSDSSSKFGRSSGSHSGVIHAEYERPRSKSGQNEIQQIRATETVEKDDFRKKPVIQADKRQKEQENSSGKRASRNQVTLQPSSIERGPVGKQSAQVSVEWVKRGTINVGQECRFDLVVKNNGETDARDVTVEAYFPTTVRLTDAQPVPDVGQDHLSWNLDSLDSQENRTIQITLIPSRRGELATTAHVRFTEAASGLFTVEEPMIKLAIQGPSKVRMGEPATQTLVVSNPGTGVAHNVVVDARIPDGLEHLRGKRLRMEIGSLSPGEKRKVRLSLAAVGGGQQKVQVQAKADAGLKHSTTADLNVIAPDLKMAVDGPGLRYLGRKATYTVLLTNDGSAATSNVRVNYPLPDGFQFVQADKGGDFDKSARTASWFIGNLEPGESTEMHVELEPTRLGSFDHQVQAVSEFGTQAQAQTETRIEGTASLVFEIFDRHDPVETDKETLYEVHVRNDGSKAAENVDIVCELPEGVELLSAEGPTAFVAEKGQLIFEPVRTLEPGKAAVFRVHVRGRKPGNHRLRAELSSDSVQEPLTAEELTKFYAD